MLWVQPLAALQLSSVQTLPSSQLIVWPLMQEPPWQVSPEVQALPSLQTATFALCWQPLVGSQLSLVHGLVSSQLTALPAWQAPLLQVSPTVQTLPSLQGTVLLADLQPP